MIFFFSVFVLMVSVFFSVFGLFGFSTDSLEELQVLFREFPQIRHRSLLDLKNLCLLRTIYRLP
jgi:hypothetical protein